MCFKKYFKNRQLEKRIQPLTEAERQAILKASPLQAGLFQGEGFHIFLKSEPDFEKAHVDMLGEVSAQFAEDWIIRQYLLSNQRDTENTES
ncbi:hypothetical protein [Spirosoma foliorum]|uniref:Uncharacterized protein n=1 Tax=Spirosoma foliorum TaxID=2710596 RepID=A0A7G5GQD4_9BACT|nr:hypothetical protein [Spirosoma foliorum]QMW01076.1 hypothetical protein H3H32_24300 [Spirosoma foliorum]